MSIETIVSSLVNKHDTRNPFEIARQCGIIVQIEPLGSIRGYYNRCFRQQFIHINSSLNREQQCFTCSHELGHAVLHPKVNTPFLRESTLFVVSRLEREANQFAIQLLYSDDEMKEYETFTIPQVARILNLHESLVEYRLKAMKREVIHNARGA